jgi:hypothetical protein
MELMPSKRAERGNGRFQKIWQKLLLQEGVETVEYVGLASVVVVLAGAVALYLSGAGQVLIDQVADIIANIIASLQQGW